MVQQWYSLFLEEVPLSPVLPSPPSQRLPLPKGMAAWRKMRCYTQMRRSHSNASRSFSNASRSSSTRSKTAYAERDDSTEDDCSLTVQSALEEATLSPVLPSQPGHGLPLLKGMTAWRKMVHQWYSLFLKEVPLSPSPPGQRLPLLRGMAAWRKMVLQSIPQEGATRRRGGPTQPSASRSKTAYAERDDSTQENGSFSGLSLEEATLSPVLPSQPGQGLPLMTAWRKMTSHIRVALIHLGNERMSWLAFPRNLDFQSKILTFFRSI